MTDLRKAAEMALEALETIRGEKHIESAHIIAKNARYSLREALAQPEQELLSLRLDIGGGFAKAVARFGSQIEFVSHELPSKPWVSLTDEEIDYIWGVTPPDYENFFEFPRAIEAALKERNT